MQILSISDIHGELDAFEILIEQLPKHFFDVVLIAGDLGGRREAKIICKKLAVFGKPVYYVMGNWDDFPYKKSPYAQTTHIHLNHQRIGDWVFLGYSGSIANGYRDHPTMSGSSAEYHSNRRRYKRKFGSYERYCKTLIFEELQAYIEKHGIDVEDLVLVTHERLYALPFFPLLYVFGHRHQPKYTFHKGVHIVNTSAVSMDGLFSRTPDAPGNYCLIKLEGLSCQVDFCEIPSLYVRQSSGWAGEYKLIRRKTGEDTGRFFYDN